MEAANSKPHLAKVPKFKCFRKFKSFCQLGFWEITRNSQNLNPPQAKVLFFLLQLQYVSVQNCPKNQNPITIKPEGTESPTDPTRNSKAVLYAEYLQFYMGSIFGIKLFIQQQTCCIVLSVTIMLYFIKK